MHLRCGISVSVILVALLNGACAINPVSRRPEFVLVSQAKEKQLGAEAAREVEQTMGLVSDSALEGYVESVGRRLAEQSPRKDVEYRFFVADVEDPNAFALPGGYVYVTRGLLALINSEDELACVIGHEIGHVAARHAVQQVSRAAPFGILTGITAGVTSLASPLLGQIVGGIGGLASGLVLSPFNREQEREADRIGQQLSAAAGWDPAAMSTFLHTLEREESLRGGAPRKFDFLATHPSTPERVGNTAAYARELQPVQRAPISRTRADFLHHLDGVVIGPSAAEGVFQGPAFLHPDLDFGLQFPGGWKTQITREQVAGTPPDRSALILLNAVVDSTDPLDGARALEKAAGAPVIDKTQRLAIGDLQGARTHLQARSDHGDLSVEFAWIAFSGRVYQIVGIIPLDRAAALTPAFDGVIRTFHRLRPAERAGIRETRLRVVAARQGETLAMLVSRVQAEWTPEMAAVANALSTTNELPTGHPVKLAIAEAYRK